MPRDWIDSDTARALLTPDDRVRLERYVLHDAGAGMDMFGVSREALGRGLAAGRFVHRHVVRVRSQGHGHVPFAGGALVAMVGQRPNAAQLMSLIVDVFVGARTPRLVRTLIDERWTAAPYAGSLARELGQVPDLVSNAEALLSAGHVLGIPIHDLDEVSYDHSVAGTISSIQGSFTVASCLDWARRHELPVIPAVLSVSSELDRSDEPTSDSLRARSSALGRRALERALFGASGGKRGRRLEIVYAAPIHVSGVDDPEESEGRVQTRESLQRALQQAVAKHSTLAGCDSTTSPFQGASAPGESDVHA